MRLYGPSTVARFNADRRGAVAVVFGVMCPVLLGVMALVIDYGRASHARSKLQTASDAAATAAAAAPDATDEQRKEIAKRYFDANNDGSFGSQLELSVTVDGDGKVTVTANSNVSATLSKLMGVDSIPVSTLSAAIANTSTSGRKLEVAMMIDLTGSMGATRNGMRKIDALQLASADLIDIFFPENAQSSSTTRVAIAPMADYVNAGPYASAVTGLADRGPYNNLTNLKSTRNGPFSGSHAGSITGGAVGSQAGATSASSPTAGATYDNGHCADPNAPGSPVAQVTHNSKPVGVEVTGSGTAPAQLLPVGSGYYMSNTWDNDDTEWEYNGESLILSSTSGYYAPIPASTAGVSYLMESGVHVGVAIDLDGGNGSFPAQVKQASAVGGYRQITGFSNGSFTLDSAVTNTGYFIPVPTTMMTGGGTLPQCTGANNANNGYLISCVTERNAAAHRTDDEAPSGSNTFLGPYNQTASGSTNKLNYSEDGRCMTAGRELPEIIPLTNQRATIEDFFYDATIGGATPGHLGHAWAWYMLSPKWNSLWPTASQAAEYTDTGVIKAAIIMTDGEYNTQYSSATSKAQALALCQGMRAQGIQVYTIGFGFSNANAAETAAADTLRQCVNNEAGHYYLAYDANALRQTFQDIGEQLTALQSNLVLTR